LRKSYEQALEKGISATGETKEFFAQGRVNWLGRCLRDVCCAPRHVLDFGCGTSTPFLLGLPGVEKLTGVEVSSKSLGVARRLYASGLTTFKLCKDFEPMGQVDLAFCNGVFHHIPPPSEREPSRLSFARYALVVFSRSGRTTRGIRELVM
jgi:SAM-dependent methyltransferase